MDKNTLVSEYEVEAANIERLQSELQATQERARSTLEALMGAHGKGPYAVNGKDVVVLRRKGTMCTMPAVRVRKNKRNTDTTDSVVASDVDASASDYDVADNTECSEDPADAAGDCGG